MIASFFVGLLARIMAPFFRAEPRWNTGVCFAEHPGKRGILCMRLRGHAGAHSVAAELW